MVQAEIFPSRFKGELKCIFTSIKEKEPDFIPGAYGCE
jgi:hypothetical protein